jgi:DNA-binding NtrC family response regulator
MTLADRMKQSGKLVFPIHVGELARRRFKMETLHRQIKKTLTEKTKASAIKKILLIGEDKDSALSAALAREGYDLVHCDSVQKAWSLVYPHRPHLMILHLHDSNGAALSDLQECWALAEGVPIIFATSARVKRALIKAIQHGAATVLAASSTPESVREVLHHLETSRMRR